MAEEIRENSNFIHDFIDKDLEDGVYSSIQTRFPPEPNGYPHIGHAKAICINFGVKEKYKGVCNLRLDDTNPTKEDTEYVDAIKEDIQWLGFQWDNLYYASDYFDFLFDCAIKLIAWYNEGGDGQMAGLCLRADAGGNARLPGHPHRAGQREPLPQPLRGGKPGPVYAHEQGRVPGGQQGAACQNRYELPQPEYEGPDHLSHYVRPPSPHRRQMVRVSHV